jgi:hypothetical protein
MNKHLKNALVAITLTVIAASAAVTAQAKTEVMSAGKPIWLPGVDLRQVPVRGSGPEADPYFQHRPAPKQVAGKAWLSGVDLRQVPVRGNGPDADPYLQHQPTR